MLNFVLDSYTAAGTIIETAEEINTYLKKINSYVDDAPEETMSGFRADSDVSRTREGLKMK